MRFGLRRASRPALAWAAVTFVAAYAIVIVQDKLGLVAGVLVPEVWVAAGAGGVVGLFSSPLFRAQWMRWYWGSLLGLPFGCVVIFLFFFLRPHAWQPTRLDAWKSVGMFLGLYPSIIVPACILAGAMGAFFATAEGDSTAS